MTLRSGSKTAHSGDLPNDWIYEQCSNAYDADLKEEGDIHAHADSSVDVYTKDLFQWVSDMCLTATYSCAEEEAEDCGSLKGTIGDQITAIQYFAIRRIASIMSEATCSQSQ